MVRQTSAVSCNLSVFTKLKVCSDCPTPTQPFGWRMLGRNSMNNVMFVRASKSTYPLPPPPQECATPTYPAVPTEFQVDVIIYDAMLLAPVIYNMCTGVNASHVFLCNNSNRIRWDSVHHTFRIRLIIRVQCASHHKNDVNLKFCRDSTHSRVAHSGGLCTLGASEKHADQPVVFIHSDRS